MTNEDGFGNEMPSALNAVNRMKCLFTNMKCYPMSDNIMNNPPVKLRLPPSFTQGGHRVSGNGFEVGESRGRRSVVRGYHELHDPYQTTDNRYFVEADVPDRPNKTNENDISVRKYAHPYCPV